MKRLLSILIFVSCIQSNKNKTRLHSKNRHNQKFNSHQSPSSSPITQTRQLVSNGGGAVNCPCAANFKCPTCGPAGYEGQMPSCPCMPQPACPNCIMGQILKSYHENNARVAKKDIATQKKLAEESIIEKKLFEQAANFASEAAAEEKLAKEASIEMSQHANKAALARQKMTRAETQVLLKRRPSRWRCTASTFCRPTRTTSPRACR